MTADPCPNGCQLAAMLLGAEERRQQEARPDDREELLSRAGLVRVGDWCAADGGHLVTPGDDWRDCRSKAYPVYVLAKTAEDAAMVRAAVA